MIKYSIIIPISKKEPEFNVTLFSLMRQNLGEITREQYEIIIVFAEGLHIKDSARKILRGVKLQLIPTQVDNAAAYRNLGAAQARGEYLIFLDSDCIPLQNWLCGYHLLQKETNAHCINGNTKPFQRIGNSFSLRLRKYLVQPIKDYSFDNKVPFYIFDSSNFLVKKDVFLMNPFLDIPRYEDHAFYLGLSYRNIPTIVSGTILVKKVIDESLPRFTKNYISSVWHYVHYHTKKKEPQFIQNHLSGSLSILSVIQNKLNISFWNKLILNLFYIIISFVGIFFHAAQNLKSTTKNSIMLAGAFFIFTMYLPYSSLKSFITTKLSYFPVLNTSFWEIYTGDGEYFSEILYRCDDGKWKNILDMLEEKYKKDKSQAIYKEIIYVRSYVYLLEFGSPELRKKIFIHERKNCYQDQKLTFKIRKATISSSGEIVYGKSKTVGEE